MNLNKVYLIGRLAADPEFRTTPSGQEVATLRVVTNRIYTDQTGQKKELAEFHTVVTWGRLAQIANQYLAKGRLVMIEGRLQTRSWEGQDGIKRYRTEIITTNLQLGPRFGDSTTPQAKEETKPQAAVTKEEIPVVNEEEPTSDSAVEETTVDLKEVPF
jgi:single-strand DNA-binding protein